MGSVFVVGTSLLLPTMVLKDGSWERIFLQRKLVVIGIVISQSASVSLASIQLSRPQEYKNTLLSLRNIVNIYICSKVEYNHVRLPQLINQSFPHRSFSLRYP